MTSTVNSSHWRKKTVRGSTAAKVRSDRTTLRRGDSKSMRGLTTLRLPMGLQLSHRRVTTRGTVGRLSLIEARAGTKSQCHTYRRIEETGNNWRKSRNNCVRSTRSIISSRWKGIYWRKFTGQEIPKSKTLVPRTKSTYKEAIKAIVSSQKRIAQTSQAHSLLKSSHQMVIINRHLWLKMINPCSTCTSRRTWHKALRHSRPSWARSSSRTSTPWHSRRKWNNLRTWTSISWWMPLTHRHTVSMVLASTPNSQCSLTYHRVSIERSQSLLPSTVVKTARLPLTISRVKRNQSKGSTTRHLVRSN